MRVHAYGGKEPGLMFIGTATDIRSLGRQLVDVCRDLPETEPIKWPRLLEAIPIENRRNYSLSFYLETSNATEPKGSGFRIGLRVTVLLFAIVGFVSIVSWIAERVL